MTGAVTMMVEHHENVKEFRQTVAGYT